MRWERRRRDWREANRVLEERKRRHDLQVGLRRAWWEKGMEERIRDATSFGRPGISCGEQEEEGGGWVMASVCVSSRESLLLLLVYSSLVFFLD